ncbi:hypothetical protein [Flammeovirga sp. EKP202]|uniref:hypothetical protein n=1 Tax=Flammeovirga sp. EKP202 TaxID=2770592 RepID=UPI00165F3D23|nr:hypothetical protein [Flammeovirga sp. EKP202]MBD0400740.1 hypothetical protein [Flammeovirga sp. EKP202]
MKNLFLTISLLLVTIVSFAQDGRSTGFIKVTGILPTESEYQNLGFGVGASYAQHLSKANYLYFGLDVKYFTEDFEGQAKSKNYIIPVTAGYMFQVLEGAYVRAGVGYSYLSFKIESDFGDFSGSDSFACLDLAAGYQFANGMVVHGSFMPIFGEETLNVFELGLAINLSPKSI